MENKIQEHLKLLDSILKVMIEKDYYRIEPYKLVNEVYNTDLKPKQTNTSNKLEDLFSDIESYDIEKTKKTKIALAIAKFDADNLLTYDGEFLRLTYEGIIQQSKGYLATNTEE